MKRADGRAPDEIRPISLERGFIKHAQGSALISFGNTKVLCVAMVEEGVPPFLKGTGKGWLTAEYSMLPYSTPNRSPREIDQKKGRSYEIQRLIGRSLRAVVDLNKIPDKTIWIDCDVLQADGGTRCAAITGSFVCLLDVDNWLQRKKIVDDTIIKDFLAAVSVGLVNDEILLDLTFYEDSRASIDMNLVMTAGKKLVELQVSGEEYFFSRELLDKLIDVAEKGVEFIIQEEKRLL
ncbi:MAG TPA: ribonuclease PH [Candidatus Aerophobetes bacterium]|uniref:Ribonuclease PH n=1 Tax=Aerophobetes bacterium TaxID=2030807 RepID=A0A7V5HZR8_UNCAE|nr:ribonuclease PH [Candidatus Aerophobetes bacterium]